MTRSNGPEKKERKRRAEKKKTMVRNVTLLQEEFFIRLKNRSKNFMYHTIDRKTDVKLNKLSV